MATFVIKYGKTLLRLLAAMMLVLPLRGMCQVPDTLEISKMSLEDLMKYKSQGIPSELEAKISSAIEVASFTPLAIRRSPAIISVITTDEIRKSGSRDLIDILKMVPGIDFGVDVEGVVGIAIRGNWANEAKVLLQINGMRMNETDFGTLQFASRFPVDQIKRIEIIRGPGSAIYGGEAEYAVINIITQSAEDINGVQANISYGTMEHALESNNYTLAIGEKSKNTAYTLTGFIGSGNRSDQNYTDIYGQSYSMATNSAIKPLNLNFSVKHKALTIHALYDQLMIATRDGYDAILSRPYNEYFRSLIADASYDFKVSGKLLVTPRFSYKRTSPWEVTPFTGIDTVDAAPVLYKTIAERYRGTLTSIWNASKDAKMTFGVEGYSDIGRKTGDEVFRNSGKAQVNYFNSAAFAEALLKHTVANLTVGARYEHNNAFGDNFVPRIGLTKRVEDIHFKLLYSQSFKAPAIENVENSVIGTIKPEKTAIWEFETGYEINKDMFVTVNLYDITTRNSIIFYVDTSSNATGINDGYLNRDKAGSQGVELEYKYQVGWGHINAGYSFYTVQNKPHIPEYTYPDDNSNVLAFPNHKVSLSSTFNITKSFFISPSFLWYSERDGVVSVDASGQYNYKDFAPSFYANLFIGHDNFLVKGLQAGIGIYDIFNQKTIYIQPYNSGHAPLPGASRELMFRLNYHFNFH